MLELNKLLHFICTAISMLHLYSQFLPSTRPLWVLCAFFMFYYGLSRHLVSLQLGQRKRRTDSLAPFAHTLSSQLGRNYNEIHNHKKFEASRSIQFLICWCLHLMVSTLKTDISSLHETFINSNSCSLSILLSIYQLFLKSYYCTPRHDD